MKLKDAWLIPARFGMAADQVCGLAETGNGLCEAVGTLAGDNDDILRAARASKPKAELKDRYPIGHFNPIGRDAGLEQQADAMTQTPAAPKESLGDKLVRFAGGLAPDQ